MAGRFLTGCSCRSWISTSGSETYPAGRYLDLDRTRTGIYLVDFNRVYNPYCYYNPTYDCPYPPSGQPPAGADSRRRESEVTLEGVVSTSMA